MRPSIAIERMGTQFQQDEQSVNETEIHS